jgi:hypothetical protein
MSSPQDDQFLEKIPKENVQTSQSTTTRQDDEVYVKEEVTEPAHENLSGPIAPAASLQYDVPESEDYNSPNKEMPKLPNSMERSYVEIEPESLDSNVSKATMHHALLPREDHFHPSSSSSHRQQQEPYSALMRGEDESRRHDGPTFDHWHQQVNPPIESSLSFDTSSKHSAANSQVEASRHYYSSNPPPRHYAEHYFNNPPPPPPSRESYRDEFYRPTQPEQSHHQPHYPNQMNQPPLSYHQHHHHEYYQPHHPPQYQYHYQNYEAPGPTQFHPNFERTQRMYSPPVQSAQRETYIEHLSTNDVLCGRGGATNSHAGNRIFREMVKKYQDKYLRAKKKDKPTVASEVVTNIRTKGGRFLEKVKDIGLWRDIGDRKAMEKTSQALREGAPKIRKQMQKHKDESIDSDGTSPEKSVGTEGQRDSNVKKEAIDEANPSKKRKLSDDGKQIGEESTKLKRVEEFQTQPEHPASGIDKEEDSGSSTVKISKRESDLQPYSMPLTRMELSKVDEKDLTQDEKSVYASFDPPKNSPRKQEKETQLLPSKETGEASVGGKISQAKSEKGA